MMKKITNKLFLSSLASLLLLAVLAIGGFTTIGFAHAEEKPEIKIVVSKVDTEDDELKPY